MSNSSHRKDFKDFNGSRRLVRGGEVCIEITMREGIAGKKKSDPRYRYVAVLPAGGILAIKTYQEHSWRESVDFVNKIIRTSPGPIDIIVTHHGPEFSSREFARHLLQCGIRHCMVSPARPVGSYIERVLSEMRNLGRII